MSAQVRDLWLRVGLGAGPTPTVVSAAAPVRVQQQLEGAVTTVAEIVLAGTSPALVTGTPLRVWHVNRNAAPDPGYPSRQLFDGIVNRISGVGTPHGVTLSCTGELARLRRTRTSDVDLSGMTEQDAVRSILAYCGIDTSGVQGWSTVLGLIVPFVWAAGRSAADLLAEFDRVYGMATIELGDGRVVRFPYSRVPSQYASPGTPRTFARGQPGAAFYGHERDRGDLDQILNYWQVSGLSWSGDEGAADEGCRYRVWATANADHPKLGPGVDVSPREFASDLIQSEAVAKAIAARLMAWYNREPDQIRIECGNDARITPGQLVDVKDAGYGIDLGAWTRYLVLAVSREGDTMLLDCVGGAAGATGTITSGIERRCGDSVSDVGTNPPPFDAPGAELPDVPGLEDVPGDLPPLDDLLAEGETPNIDDLLINCEDAATGLHDPAYVVGGPWRESGGPWGWPQETPEGGTPGASFQNAGITLLGTNGVLIYNQTPIGESKTPENDHRFGKNEGVSVSGVVTLNYPGTIFRVRLEGVDGNLGINLAAAFYTEPGHHTAPFTSPYEGGGEHPGGDWGLVTNSENGSGGLPGIAAGYPEEDLGGVRGGPLPAGTELAFSVQFDPASEYQSVAVGGTIGTYMTDRRYQIPGDLDLHYEDCDHSAHVLWLQAVSDPFTAPPDGDWFAKPLIEITALSLGLGTCELNPDYLPPPTPGDF